MRAALFLLGLSLQAQSVFFPGPGGKSATTAVISFLNSATAGSVGGGSVTTSAVDTTGATGIVLAITQTTGTTTPADSKGNTWTSVSSQTSSFIRAQLFYCVLPCSVGAGHTFSSNGGAATFSSITVLSFTGTSASTFYDSHQSSAAGGATSGQPGAVTCSLNNCLYVTAIGFDGASGTPTINLGFNTAVGTPFLAANHYGTFMSYFIQTTATALNPTWSYSSVASAAILSAAFRPLP